MSDNNKPDTEAKNEEKQETVSDNPTNETKANEDTKDTKGTADAAVGVTGDVPVIVTELPDKKKSKALKLFEKRQKDIKERGRKKSGMPVWAIALISVAALVLVVYLGGAVYFAGHFTPNTKVNGVDVGMMSAKRADDALSADRDAYVLTITAGDMTEKLAVGDGGLAVHYEEELINVIHKQNPFFWVYDVFSSDSYKVGYVTGYKKEDLEKYIDTLSFMDPANMTPSTDAYVELADGEVKVVEDVTGTEILPDETYSAIETAIDQMQPALDLGAAGCFKRAAVTADSSEIKADVETCEKYLNQDMIYDFGDYQYHIPKEEITKMASFKDGKIEIDENAVRAYAKKFAEEFTTLDKPREFITHDKKDIIIEGGYYGWEIDEEAEEELLVEDMMSKKSFEREPECYNWGYSFSEMNDIGDSYVEVDLTDQHVYLFVEGKMVFDTDCVTGNPPSLITPGGVYPIAYCATNATLKGPGYETKVAYWMPFNYDIGLHDATWRSSFGGDIYTYDGSHGCVNLSYSAAETIFSYVEAGFPVVCYWE